MIVWLASYPKSGNTLIRSMLAAYFFSKDGIYNFDLIKNIKQFPKTSLFEKMAINIRNEREIVKNYIAAQETFNKKNSIQFLKTHSYLFDIEGHRFTDLKNSLGVIYIVRDPRNVVTSWANFANISIEKAADKLINTTRMGGNIYSFDKNDQIIVYTGNWSSHYRSWKSFKYQDRYLLIKYEDLINNRDFIFKKILKFLYKLKNTKFIINQKKFKNVIETTDFHKMKEIEEQKGFFEGKVNLQTGKRIPFFNLGPKNDWKKLLNIETKKNIEEAFKKEMVELGYL